MDRPIAIAGLEKRLISSLGVRGGYGVVDDGRAGLLSRSLLWCRGSNEASLERIAFHSGGQLRLEYERAPPSWSWMAYQGGIDYLDVPFGAVNWETFSIPSPWFVTTEDPWGDSVRSDLGRLPSRGRSVLVRSFETQASEQTDLRVIYDSPAKSSGYGEDLKCLILGTLKTRPGSLKSRHYIMLVVPTNSDSGRGRGLLYERVGVGYLPGHCIDFDSLGSLVSLI